MKKVKVYEVYRNDDMTEGRGRQVILGRYTTWAMAYHSGLGQDVQGTNCQDIREVEVDFHKGNYYRELPVFEETEEIKRARKMEALESIVDIDHIDGDITMSLEELVALAKKGLSV